MEPVTVVLIISALAAAGLIHFLRRQRPRRPVGLMEMYRAAYPDAGTAPTLHVSAVSVPGVADVDLACDVIETDGRRVLDVEVLRHNDDGSTLYHIIYKTD